MTPRRLCLMFAAMLVSHKPLAAAAERLLFETDWRAGVDVRLGVQAAAPSDVWVEHALGMQMPAHRLHVRIRRDADFSRVANGAPRAKPCFPTWRVLRRASATSLRGRRGFLRTTRSTACTRKS